VYAVGGRPLVAVNLLGWPRDVLPFELAKEVLRSGLAIAHEAQCQVGGGHSIDDPEPKYGMAVTGVADPTRLLRNEAGAVGDALSLRKPLGGGRAEQPAQANRRGVLAGGPLVTALNALASQAVLAIGARGATDVSGFGLLGHLAKLARVSGVTAVIEAAAVPHLDASRESAAAGYISGGTLRNLAWVKAHTDFGSLPELEQLLLADAQTSGGLLPAAELPGCRVIGELVERTESSGPSTTLWCASELESTVPQMTPRAETDNKESIHLWGRDEYRGKAGRRTDRAVTAGSGRGSAGRGPARHVHRGHQARVPAT
jgi:selenide,water dikinase